MMRLTWTMFAAVGIALSIAQVFGLADGDAGQTLQTVMLALILAHLWGEKL